MEKQSAASSLLEIVTLCNDKLIVFKGFERIEDIQGKKHLIFRKQGVNMDKWIGLQLKDNNNKINLPFVIKAIMQVIEIAEILQKYSLSIAD